MSANSAVLSKDNLREQPISPSARAKSTHRARSSAAEGHPTAGYLSATQALAAARAECQALPDPQLKNLTKEQLLALINQQGWQADSRDIARAVWGVESQKANRQLKTAQKRCTAAAADAKDTTRFVEARVAWEKASQRLRALNAYFRQWIGGEGKSL